jgi:hypothetical protein
MMMIIIIIIIIMHHIDTCYEPRTLWKFFFHHFEKFHNLKYSFEVKSSSAQGLYVHGTPKLKDNDRHPCFEWYSNPRSQCLGSHDPSLRLPILHNKSIQCDIATYLDDSVRCSMFTVHLTHAFTGKCWSRHNALHSAEGCSRLAGRGGQRLVKRSSERQQRITAGKVHKHQVTAERRHWG